MALSTVALELIKRDSDLRAKLMLVPYKPTGKGASEFTLQRWLNMHSDNLTMPKYTAVIMEHTGLSMEEIVVTDKQPA